MLKDVGERVAWKCTGIFTNSHVITAHRQLGVQKQLFVGFAKEPATEATASPEHCCKNCHSFKQKKSDHITPILRELHWLPVETRIDYKILFLVHSCMNGTAPKCLRELIPRYLPVRHLRSSTQSRLRIPSVDQGKIFFGGIRAFSSAAPKLWNSLPITLREHNSKETFKKNMKTYLLSEN